jgi:hypothetical protein
VPELNNTVLCDGCADRLQDGETIGYWDIVEPEAAPSLEASERFERLFEAARVLRKEGIADEDLIYPTLAYANELGQGITVLEQEALTLISSANSGADWEAACERFSRKHGGLIPVRVVDGVLILRWVPVVGDVRFYQVPDMKIPEVVAVRIRLHAGPLEVGLISRVYERTLSAYGLRHGMCASGRIDYEAPGGELIISSYASTDTAPHVASEHAAVVFGDRAPEFAHPDLMEQVGQVLLGSGRKDKPGFDRFLNRRKGGPPPTRKPELTTKLIRACVAYFLNQHGELPKGKAAHRLLNKHVLPLPDGVGELPETGDSSHESTELWRSAKKASLMLEAATRAIYDQEFTA